jgi:maltose-binding protein MalE
MKTGFGALTRRRLLQRAALAGVGAGALAAGWRPGHALAAAEDDAVVAAANEIGGGEVTGMIWSNYMSAMQASADRFADLTGIAIGNIQDISVFDIPARAMAEAVSQSPEFDFFHVDSNMIPSLASAGLLEPLDEYMQKADFKIDAVGDFANFMTYKGSTYGVPTDGNVHTQFVRWDLVEQNRAAFEDHLGHPAVWPETWEEDLEWMKFFNKPENEMWGSANLRNRANGVTWWYMYFYSAGGFPFDDDMNPTLATAAGEYAVKTFLDIKQVSHPEAPGWGTPQMIPRIVGDNAFACQYWDGIIALAENPEKSKTTGKWKYGLVPGSNLSGKQIYRSISSPLAAILINRHSPRKERAAMLALWWGTLANSEEMVADPVNTFHDPWHKGHMTSEMVAATYTQPGLEAIEKNLQVSSPPIYLTGYLEFQDALAKNLSEAYVGQIAAGEVIQRTEEAWKGVVRRIGKAKLAEELASYKAVFPTKDQPT